MFDELFEHISFKRIFKLALKTAFLYSIFLAILFAIPYAHGLYAEMNQTSIKKDAILIIGDKRIHIEKVETHKDRQIGLSKIDVLSEDEGMLFIFDSSGKHGIWMKDMSFSIDIIWLNENLEIIHYEKNISPETYPTVFYPGTNAKYVLEVVSGFMDKNEIYLKDQATIFKR